MYLKTLLLSICLASSSLVSAHYVITDLFIDNGKNEVPGKCLRVPPNTDPLLDVNSKDLACNVGGENGAARVCPIAAGDSIGLQWREWPDASQPGFVGHDGPCTVYMKKVNDATKDSGSGPGWFKIYEDGYRDGNWCSKRINDNGGKLTVKIPRDLAGGQYLIRGEHIGLHNAKDEGMAQFFVGCGQLIVTSLGGSAKPETVSIPGCIHANDPGVLFDWDKTSDLSTYIVPGPKVYQGSTSGLRSRPDNKDLVQEPGNWDCVVENANWCAKPLGKYTSADDCSNVVGKCWSQLNNCYNDGHTTGETGCRKYEDLCTKYSQKCNSCKGTCTGSFR